MTISRVAAAHVMWRIGGFIVVLGCLNFCDCQENMSAIDENREALPEGGVGEILLDSKALAVGDPITGFVRPMEDNLLRIKLPKNGTDFPNVLLTLTVNNDDGDADIFCTTGSMFEDSGVIPSHVFAFWQSTHSQGADYVFISRKHPRYSTAEIAADSRVSPEGVEFVCSVHGFALNGTDYTVELDVDYSDRSLNESDKAVMQEIFEQCCTTSAADCSAWKSEKDSSGEIDMDFCHKEGSICDGTGSLVRLNLLKAGLNCEFPTNSIVKLKSLKNLNMALNNLKGNVGEIFSILAEGLPEIHHIDFESNSLRGEISAEVDGRIPVCVLCHKKNLLFLDVSENHITGGLPDCFFDGHSTLGEILLERNKMGGQLPEFSEDTRLQVLRLAYNEFEGTIPPALSKFQRLIDIDLSANRLSGEIPSDIGNIPSLRVLRLGGNSLEGNIPDSLFSAQSLEFLHLDTNWLTGFGSGWYGEKQGASRMIIFDAAHNNLEGEFPMVLARSPNLTVLNLEANKLSGPLPDERGMMPFVAILMLGGNTFEGRIPEALGSIGFFQESVRSTIPSVPEIDLSHNFLTGEIPEFFHAGNIPKHLEGAILLGGNKFDLPCPIPNSLAYIAGIECEEATDGTAKIESDMSASSGDSMTTTEPPQNNAVVSRHSTQPDNKPVATQSTSNTTQRKATAAAAENSTTNQDKRRSNLSGIETTGIAVAVIVVVLFVTGAILVLFVNARQKKKMDVVDRIMAGNVELGNGRRGKDDETSALGGEITARSDQV